MNCRTGSRYYYLMEVFALNSVCAGSPARNLSSSQPALKLEPLFGQFSKVQIMARGGTAQGTDPNQFAAPS